MAQNVKKVHPGKSLAENDFYRPVYQYSAPVNSTINKYYYSTDELPVFSGWTRGTDPIFYAYREQVYGSISVYQYSNVPDPNADSYFLLSLIPEGEPISGWYYTGFAFYACPHDAGQTVNVNPFYNNSFGIWSSCCVPDIECPLGYVPSSAEMNTGFAVPLSPSSTSVSGAVPIYFYSRPLDKLEHETFYYSTNQNGLSGWDYKGIAFYAYKSQAAGTIPVYGSRKTLADGSSIYRLDSVQWSQDGWNYEGIAFYAFPGSTEMAGTTLIIPSCLSIAGEPGTFSTYYFTNGVPKNYVPDGKFFSAFKNTN